MAVSEIEGRRDHVLQLVRHPAGHETVSVFPDLIREVMGRGDWYHTHYRIVQTGPNRLEVLVDRDLAEEKRGALIASFESALSERGILATEIACGRFPEADASLVKKTRIMVL